MQNYMTTEQAAEKLHLSIAHVQRLCRNYHANGRGLTCDKAGTGRRAIYLIHSGAIAAYKAEEHKPGWPKGKKRKE